MTNDHDADENRRRIIREGRSESVPRNHLPEELPRECVARAVAQPYLGARTSVRRHDERWGEPA